MSFRRQSLVILLSLPVTVSAMDAGALLQAAEAHYLEAGREEALKDFTHDSRFIHGSLYVFCVDSQKRLSASGGFPRMVGVEIDRFEVGGRSGLATRMQQDASDDGEGQLNYDWLNPSSGAIEPKKVQFRRFGEDVCGVGVYVPAPSGPPRRRR